MRKYCKCDKYYNHFDDINKQLADIAFHFETVHGVSHEISKINLENVFKEYIDKQKNKV